LHISHVFCVFVFVVYGPMQSCSTGVRQWTRILIFSGLGLELRDSTSSLCEIEKFTWLTGSSSKLIVYR